MKKTLTFLALGTLLATGYKSTAQYTEDFESTTGTALPTGWSQNVVPNDSTGWLSGTNTTLASSYFSPNAHTRFVCVNDDKYQGGPNGNSLLKSSTFNVPTTMAHPYLSFDCSYRHGNDGGTPAISEVATVEISTDNGATWTVLSTLAGNTAYWWEPRYIDLSGHTGTGLMLGFRYQDGGAWLYGFAIDNVKVFDAPATDLALTSITPTTGSPTSYGVGGSTVNMTGTVFNNGATAVPSYNINYLFNGGAVVSSPIAGSIAPFTSANFTAPTAVTFPAALGSYPIKMWVSLTGDANATNDSSATNSLTTVSFLPTKKVMFEEPTGTWCGWCVRGIIYMDSLWAAHKSNVSVVSVHDYNGYDPMAHENTMTTNYDNFMAGKVGGFPSLVVDRRTYSADPSQAFTYYDALNTSFGFADMSVNASVSGSNLNVSTAVKPALNLSGDYRLELIVSEDGVKGTAAGYAQHNYYNGGGSGAMQNAEYNFATLPSTIPAAQMSYDFVDRYTIPDMSTSPNGVASSLPASMTAGTTYNYTFAAVPIASTWVSAKLRATVLLIDNNSTSPNYGTILNSVNTVWTVGVNNVSAGIEGVRVFPNPANEETNIAFELNNNSNVSVVVYDAVGRVVYTKAAQAMNSGSQNVNINVADFAAGVYNVVIATETGKISERFSVIK